MGVRRIKEFNLSLIGKWCWRLKEERGSLWVRVYLQTMERRATILVKGEDLLHLGGRIYLAFEVGVGVGNWFDENLCREVGDGINTLFWSDHWLDGGVLKDIFSRLFTLADNKMAIVADMSSWGWGEGGEAWKWQRRLLAWEQEKLRECCMLMLVRCRFDNFINLQNIMFLVRITTCFQWTNISLLIIQISFGIRRFHWKSTSLFGVCYVIVYQLLIT